MDTCYLLLGSNLGDRLKNFERAHQLLAGQAGTILQKSAVYQTAAWGKEDQPSFYNQVTVLETPLRPLELLYKVLAIETEIGRVRLEHWGPRVIDIDILFFGNHIIEHQRLTVPHPQLHLRAFTLVPLSEIAPDLVHPVLKMTCRELLENCPDGLEVKQIETIPAQP